MRYYTSPYSFKCFTLVKYCGFPTGDLYMYLINTYFREYSTAELLNALDIVWNFTSVSYLDITYGQNWHPDYESMRYNCDILREPDYRTSTRRQHNPSALSDIHTFLNTNVAEFFRGYLKYISRDTVDLASLYNSSIDNGNYLIAFCIYGFYHPENSSVSDDSFDYRIYYNPDHTNIIDFFNKMYRHNLQ